MPHMEQRRPKKIIIAIDGYSACGKSTLAKDLSRELGYIYIDSGAMYRAVTLYMLENRVDLQDREAVGQALSGIHIHFEIREGEDRTFLNGREVETAIRGMEVSQQVSTVAAIPEVRRSMVRLQQQMGHEKGIVMDGRDIGTVVFPEAELKIFLTADTAERVQRRLLEMLSKNIQADVDTIRDNLLLRDRIDSTREDSPLRQADDAVVIDNTHLSRAEQLEKAKLLVTQVLEKTAA